MDPKTLDTQGGLIVSKPRTGPCLRNMAKLFILGPVRQRYVLLDTHFKTSSNSAVEFSNQALASSVHGSDIEHQKIAGGAS